MKSYRIMWRCLNKSGDFLGVLRVNFVGNDMPQELLQFNSDFLMGTETTYCIFEQLRHMHIFIP